MHDDWHVWRQINNIQLNYNMKMKIFKEKLLDPIDMIKHAL